MFRYYGKPLPLVTCSLWNEIVQLYSVSMTVYGVRFPLKTQRVYI